MKKRIVSAILTAALAATMLILSSCNSKSVKVTTQLKITAGDDTVYNGSVAVEYENPSVLDIIEEAGTKNGFEVKFNDEKTKVTKIGNYEEKTVDGKEYYFKFTVNGKSLAANQNASDISLNDGDTVAYAYYVGQLDANNRYVETPYKPETKDTETAKETTKVTEKVTETAKTTETASATDPVTE